MQEYVKHSKINKLRISNNYILLKKIVNFFDTENFIWCNRCIYLLRITFHHMKLIKTLFLLSITSLITNTAYASSVDKIDVLNSHEIELTLSSDVVLSDNVNWDIKVLKDILVSFAVRDINDYNKVILTLEEDLEMLTNYNLLTIFGANGNIDFKTEKSLEDVEIMNAFQPEDQWIAKIVTVNDRTLEVYFKNPVEDTEFEFKIFSEIFVDSITNTGTKSVKLHLENAVTSYSQYMLMILSLQDANLKNLKFEEELYNFETLWSVEVIKEDAPTIDDNGDEVTELENIALNAAETPDTGAETWVLVMLTLLVNAGLLIRKKIKN